MKIFFDNCTPPVLASTLHGFVSRFDHAAAHISELEQLPKGRGTPDVDWIRFLAEAPERWIFITADDRIRRMPAERTAMKASGLCGFVFAKGFQKLPLHLRASLLVERWPDIWKAADEAPAPAMYEIPVGRRTTFRPMSL